MVKRSLILPEPGTESFFLWGPRQTGKSTLLREMYGDCRWITFSRPRGRPEKALLRRCTEGLYDLAHHEALPRGSDLRVSLEVMTIANVQ